MRVDVLDRLSDEHWQSRRVDYDMDTLRDELQGAQGGARRDDLLALSDAVGSGPIYDA